MRRVPVDQNGGTVWKSSKGNALTNIENTARELNPFQGCPGFLYHPSASSFPLTSING